MASEITPLQQIIQCIEKGNDFVLQGGAGSGKTETLNQVLSYISDNYPNRMAACITHTNLAAEEIAKRVGGGHKISTIHSFFNGLIKNYTRDIHDVIFELFKVKTTEESKKNNSDTAHKSYKDSYNAYSNSLYSIKGEKTPKCIGKREFDKSPTVYTEALDHEIEKLNSTIKQTIQDTPHNGISYNESPFNRLDELSFGHDGLLTITCLLLKRRPTLFRILFDKYDYLFIDEYQDTNPSVIETVVSGFNSRPNKVLGLFGDSMQGIYKEGVGDVESYIQSEKLYKINKPDNYRCSDAVIKFINKFRIDNLKQELALKKINEIQESRESRNGTVTLYYTICDNKPTIRSKPNEKEDYFDKINKLVELAMPLSGAKILMLTNKAISKKSGFGLLYDVFSERYGRTTNERLDDDLSTLQYNELFTLINLYKKNKYSELISLVKKSGFKFETISSKQTLVDIFEQITNDKLSAEDAINLAFSSNIIRESESRRRFIFRKDKFIDETTSDVSYQNFKALLLQGISGLSKLTEHIPNLDEYDFETYSKNILKGNFYNHLFATKIPLKEVISYFKYLNEETNYITMHKTKGSGITDTLVVMEDYLWPSYQFNNLFAKDTFDELDSSSKKILYVACSRTIRNLICVRLISQDEKNNLNVFFDNVVELTL